MTIEPGIHGSKLQKLLSNSKLPKTDRKNVALAIELYNQWRTDINQIDSTDIDSIIHKYTDLLNGYKFFVEYNLIFLPENDFLYRQNSRSDKALSKS